MCGDSASRPGMKRERVSNFMSEIRHVLNMASLRAYVCALFCSSALFSLFDLAQYRSVPLFRSPGHRVVVPL